MYNDTAERLCLLSPVTLKCFVPFMILWRIGLGQSDCSSQSLLCAWRGSYSYIMQLGTPFS